VDVVIIAVYGPMIYTSLYVMLLIKATPLRGQVGEGWALEIETFLGPVKWHRAVSLSYAINHSNRPHPPDSPVTDSIPRDNAFKVPKCEIFDLFDFNDIYVIKSL
jgi:hypothetical protein